MSNLFLNYPKTVYQFGNETSYTVFNDLTVYIDVFDQVKNNIQYYTPYTIQENDRPDTLSEKLYGTTDYHWTFLLLNDKLRSAGWPLTEQEILKKIKKIFPNQTVVTNTVLAYTKNNGTYVSLFNPTDVYSNGDPILCFGKTSGTYARIKDRNLNLGQVVFETGTYNVESNTFTSDSTLSFNNGEIIYMIRETDLNKESDDRNQDNRLVVRTVMEEYNSLKYYRDDDGNIIDVKPTLVFIDENGTQIPVYNDEDADLPEYEDYEERYYSYYGNNYAIYEEVTHLQYYVEQNRELKNISIIKKELIGDLVAEYNRLLTE